MSGDRERLSWSMAAKRSEMRECFDLLNANRSGNEVGRASHHHRTAAVSTAEHHHHHHHHHHLHRHHHRTNQNQRTQNVTTYGEFKASILTDPSLPFSFATEGDRDTDANGTLMLSAFRRKATLDEFMNNGSARARLAKMGEATGSAEKMTRSSSSEHLSSKGSMSNHSIGTREHTSRGHTSSSYSGPSLYSQSRRKQRNKLAAFRRSAKDAASIREGAGERALESAPSLQGFGVRGGSVLRGSRYGPQKSGSSFLNSSLSAFGNRSMTSLPSVRSSRELGPSTHTEYMRAPKTASRAKRLKSPSKHHHEHVSHLAWQQQLLLLRKFGGGEVEAEPGAEATSKPTTEAAAPPANLEALQARDKRPSTSMVMEDASRKLEEAQALFSQSRIFREPMPIQQRARTTTAGGSANFEKRRTKRDYEHPDIDDASTSPFPPAPGTAAAAAGGIITASSSSSATTRQRPWSRYKTWRVQSVQPPWLAAGNNNAKSSQNSRIALMRNGNGRATHNEMEIKLYAMSLVR